MTITLHKIGQRDRKIPISILVGEPGKIRQTAWQNLSDMAKIRSATVCGNTALALISSIDGNITGSDISTN
jgi:hypothetical protein